MTSVDNRSPGPDGNRTTVDIRTERTYKGSAGNVRLRFGEGYNNDGSVADITGVVNVLQGKSDASFRPGDRLLIFASRAAYAEGSVARGGAPLSGHTQALALFKIINGQASAIGNASFNFPITELENSL
ncbi:hypothetical protein [Tsuneonella litorea]|uniref:hypothetical protein n=1 Tax=Tsuneonella litorea TaxID=2976475 RepID=UPI0021A3F65C|nr:hypothetical protein [Tsuneonella litorea]